MCVVYKLKCSSYLTTGGLDSAALYYMIRRQMEVPSATSYHMTCCDCSDLILAHSGGLSLLHYCFALQRRFKLGAIRSVPDTYNTSIFLPRYASCCLKFSLGMVDINFPNSQVDIEPATQVHCAWDLVTAVFWSLMGSILRFY